MGWLSVPEDKGDAVSEALGGAMGWLSVPEGDGGAVSGWLSAGVVMAGEFFFFRPLGLRRVKAVIAAARRGRSVMSPDDR